MHRAWRLVPLGIAILKDGSHLQLKGYMGSQAMCVACPQGREDQRPRRRKDLDPKTGFLRARPCPKDDSGERPNHPRNSLPSFPRGFPASSQTVQNTLENPIKPGNSAFHTISLLSSGFHPSTIGAFAILIASSTYRITSPGCR